MALCFCTCHALFPGANALKHHTLLFLLSFWLQGIDPDVLERLSSWTIEARRVSVVVSADVDAAHHAATLTNVLEQLPALKVSMP